MGVIDKRNAETPGARTDHVHRAGLVRAILLTALWSLALVANGTTREDAMKPHVDALWSEWKKLPESYQNEKRQDLEKFLSEFTTTNAAGWTMWSAVVEKMGPEFKPLHIAFMEAQKVAEAYEAAFPDPEQKLPAIADVILERVPTNALLFAQTDLFETFLRLRVQEGKRRDVIVLNSSRIIDTPSLDLALREQRVVLARSAEEMCQKAFQEALDRNKAGDAEFSGMEISGGVVNAKGAQILDAITGLLVKELSAAMPERPVILLPASTRGASTAGFVAMTNASLLFATDPNGTSGGQGLVEGWRKLLDVAAPEGKPLHVELARTLDNSIEAAATILRSRHQKESAEKLISIWELRLNQIRQVRSRAIRINSERKMVEQSGE